jgi:hypothetical protein
MIYNHFNESEDEQPISKEDLEALVFALGHTSINNDAALRPTVKALEKLASEQETAQKKIISLEQKIGLLILEIGELKHRESDQNARLDKHMNRPTIAAFSILLGVIILVPSALLYTFVPSKADRDISDIKEKSQFLYFQELDRFKKKKK